MNTVDLIKKLLDMPDNEDISIRLIGKYKRKKSDPEVCYIPLTKKDIEYDREGLIFYLALDDAYDLHFDGQKWFRKKINMDLTTTMRN